MTATLEKSNRVKSVALQVAPMQQALVATDLYPMLQVMQFVSDMSRIAANSYQRF